ncbi:YoaK family protein [Ochrobactrum sp. GPK 3]|uniref:YoaK family protein n=1 Tax=Brucella sp. 22210 TaxID=3453892 RepID=UPI0031385C6A
MLIKLKKTRSHLEDRKLALWLATLAGLLNAMALGAFGFFPSHMSGNASHISREISALHLNEILFLGSIIMSFATGAICSRLIVVWGAAYNNRLIFCQILLLEGGILTGVSVYEVFFYSASSNGKMILILSALMGMHNAISTQLSNGRVRSTHITGAITDAGISLASLLSAFFCRHDGKEFDTQVRQLTTHLITIFSFSSGAIAGLVLFKWLSFQSMAAVGMTLTGLAMSSMLVVRRHVNSIGKLKCRADIVQGRELQT